MNEVLAGKTVVAYGAGECFRRFRDVLLDRVGIGYVCDRKFREGQGTYMGIPAVSYAELLQMPRQEIAVVVTVDPSQVCTEIMRQLSEDKIPCLHVYDVVENRWKSLTGEQLKREFPSGEYRDSRKNLIRFDSSIPSNIHIEMRGSHNQIRLGRFISVYYGQLVIICGNASCVSIGDCTGMGNMAINASDACVEIGCHCLFSHDIVLHSHDGHHIFDMHTGARLNPPKDIHVGQHVWIGEKVTLMGGASIGDGSVVGCGSVTSSRFPGNAVIAGAPAKVLRRDIVWSKDCTVYFNWSSFSECIDQTAILCDAGKTGARED